MMILRWLLAFGASAYLVLPSVALEKEYRIPSIGNLVRSATGERRKRRNMILPAAWACASDSSSRWAGMLPLELRLTPGWLLSIGFCYRNCNARR